MHEITVSFNCSQDNLIKARYILNLVSSIASIKFKNVESNAQVIYGTDGDNARLHIPYIEYEFSDDEWQLSSSRTRLILPGFIQPQSLEVDGNKLGIDLFRLAFRFLALSLNNDAALDLSPGKIKTNLRHVYPFFNSYVDLFLDSLKAAGILPANYRRMSPWPDQAPFAVGLSHDLDIHRRRLIGGIKILIRSIFSNDIPGGITGSVRGLTDTLRAYAFMDNNPYRQLRRWQEIDNKSTLFLFAGKRKSSQDPTYKVEKVARELRNFGNNKFEIAYHNGINTWDQAELLNANMEKLRQLFSAEITGIRPHYLDLKLPAFWKNANRFEYSSSVGSDTIPGFTGGLNHPFFGFDFETGESLDILELPIGIMDCALFKIRDKVLRERTISEIISNCKSHSGMLILDWHVRTAYEPDFPEWLDTYKSILNIARSNGAYIASLDEINRHWRKHCASVFLS